MEELFSLFGTWYIQVIGLLIGVDVLLGIIAAILKKDFAFRKLALFMKGPVLAYIFGFAVLEMFVKGLPQGGNWVLNISFILVAIALLGSIARNSGRMGLPLPGALGRE